MTEQQLQQIAADARAARERAEKASAASFVSWTQASANITASRADVPLLAAHIDALLERVAELEAKIESRDGHCEGCGMERPPAVGLRKVRTTNGVLTLCMQCLGDVNRKNPRIADLEAQHAADQQRIAELEDQLSDEARVALITERDKLWNQTKEQWQRIAELEAEVARQSARADLMQAAKQEVDERLYCALREGVALDGLLAESFAYLNGAYIGNEKYSDLKARIGEARTKWRATP